MLPAIREIAEHARSRFDPQPGEVIEYHLCRDSNDVPDQVASPVGLTDLESFVDAWGYSAPDMADADPCQSFAGIVHDTGAVLVAL
jgi:hypothetical protein